jgi:hypothetical protein
MTRPRSAGRRWLCPTHERTAHDSGSLSSLVPSEERESDRAIFSRSRGVCDPGQMISREGAKEAKVGRIEERGRHELHEFAPISGIRVTPSETQKQ